MRFIAEMSTIFLRLGRLFQLISDLSPRADISPINWRYFDNFLVKFLILDFSPQNSVLTPPDTRYITDISQHFPPCRGVGDLNINSINK